MKIDCFEKLFPGLAVYDDETDRLVVSLDGDRIIVQGRKNQDGDDICWWHVLPSIMIEQNPDCLGFDGPTSFSILTMLRGAELVTDPESAESAVRDWVFEEIWSKARRDKTLIKDA